MKASIQDKALLNGVSPNLLQNYLQQQGWVQVKVLDNACVYEKDFRGEKAEVVVLLDKTFSDYPHRISDALQNLEIVEQRSQLELLGQLIAHLPNVSVQGIVTNLNEGASAGKVTLLGVVLDRLQRIQLELTEPTYEMALQAYRARFPVICEGDLVRGQYGFEIQNLKRFTLDPDVWERGVAIAQPSSSEEPTAA